MRKQWYVNIAILLPQGIRTMLINWRNGMTLKAKSSFTVLGFSKTGFGCCGNHFSCQLGKLDCAIEDKDPEAKNYCHCYQRNHRPYRSVEPIRIENPAVQKEEVKTEVELFVANDGQLMLF